MREPAVGRSHEGGLQDTWDCYSTVKFWIELHFCMHVKNIFCACFHESMKYIYNCKIIFCGKIRTIHSAS